MTKRKHLKRRARERASKTGERYTAALRHLRTRAEEAPMPTAPKTFTITCSFCAKDDKHVKKLIAGPGVYICDECVGLCNAILEEEAKGAVPGEARAASLDEGPVETLVTIFGAMARTARSMDDRLGEWARTLSQRGVATSTLASEAGLTEAVATERFGL